MIGEQWVCRCGIHNISLRRKCRGCGDYKNIASVGHESVFEVMERVARMNHSEKVVGADNQQGSRN